jgi:hypothetical protein
MSNASRLLFAAVLVAGACGKSNSSNSKSGPSAKGGDSSKPKPAPKPLDISFHDDELTAGEGKGHVLAMGSNVTFTVEGFPKGTEYEVGDQKGEIEDSYGKNIDVDVKQKLGDTQIDDLEKFDSGLTLTISFPDGRTGSAKVPPVNFKFGLSDFLKKAEHGPVMFGKEGDDPKKTDSLLYPVAMDVKVVGRAGKLSEVDYIALANLSGDAKSTKTCGGYHDNDGKAMPDITLNLKETEVVIYDRRTGDVVQKKTFPPDDECPMFTFQQADQNSTDSSIPEEQVEAWLKTQVKR